ncbi:MAG: hypothetical protein AAFX79_06045 [Planctomycetota bacterium]
MARSSTKRGSKKATKKRGSSRAAETPTAWPARRIAVLVASVLIATGVVLAGGLGMPALRDHAAGILGTRQPTLALHLYPPRWMPRDEAERIRRLASDAYAETATDAASPSREALSAAPLKAIHDVLVDTGWAATPPRVRRGRLEAAADAEARPRSDVIVEMAWRRPAAVVRWVPRTLDGTRGAIRDTAIDREARVLPLAGPPESLAGWPVILVPQDTPTATGAAGTTWPGRDVADALGLLELLADEEFFEQVAAVDLAEYARGRRMLLVSRRGGRVVWGAPEEAGVFQGEVDDARKLANLRSLVQATGYIDGGEARTEIMLSGPVVLEGDPGAP